MFGLFIQSVAGSSGVGDRAAGSRPAGVGYDSALPKQLQQEHQQLLRSCERLEIAHARGKEARVRTRLRDLREELSRHRLREDNKVLVLLERLKSSHGHIAGELRMLRRQRDGLRRQVTAFFDRYGDGSPETLRSPRFGEDLAIMGDALVRLIELEEGRVFPLYHQAGESGL